MGVQVVKLFKSVIESTEPMGDIEHTRPSFYITPTHVQVSFLSKANELEPLYKGSTSYHKSSRIVNEFVVLVSD